MNICDAAQVVHGTARNLARYRRCRASPVILHACVVWEVVGRERYGGAQLERGGVEWRE